MNIINFIQAHWDIITLVIVATAALVFAIFKGNKSVVMSMLFSLVTDAEKNFGSGPGALKLASVITEIYPKLPTVIKTFISAQTLQKWVEDALAMAKKKWEDNANIKAYIEDAPTEYVDDFKGDYVEEEVEPPEENENEETEEITE